MPTRLIREGILSSEAVNSLIPEAEVFYRRLMSVVDDYGRYSASPKLLRSGCYPLQIDKVSDTDVTTWMQQCASVGLVRIYLAVDGKWYLEMQKFGQSIRSKSKCPEPIAQQPQTVENNCSQPPANAHLCGCGCGVVCEVGVVCECGCGGVGVEEKQQLQQLPKKQAQRQESEQFAMDEDWQPSENFTTIARLAGAPSPTPSDVGEFVAYWLGKKSMTRTQHEWEHALAKSLKKSGSRPKTAGKAAGVESFAEQDARTARERWEQMTGNIHPENQRQSNPVTVLAAITTRSLGVAQ